jgi:hypothetical protein
MDDRELEAMFAAAPGEPPPPTFSRSDVVTASKRARARRRSAIAVMCACLVVLMGGFGIFTLVDNMGQSPLTTASSAGDAPVSGQSGVTGQPGNTSERPSSAGEQGFPPQSPMQGGDESGKNGPRAEGTSGCDKVDRELATALAGELPVPVTVADATPGHVCPTGSRSAGFPVANGVVSITLVPPGVALQLAPQPAGTVHAEYKAASGGTVWLLSIPQTGAAAVPFAGDIDRIAQSIAARF